MKISRFISKANIYVLLGVVLCVASLCGASPTKLSFLGNGANKLKESNAWEAIDIGLNEKSDVDVTFDYCFDFISNNGITGFYAGFVDVAESDADHNFPVCGAKSATVTIPAGQKKALEIYVKPLLDGAVETDEKFWIQINNINGAELTDDYDKGRGYPLYIVSEDALPVVEKELVVNVNEDEKYTFNKADFAFNHATQDFASVIITSLPNKGSLVLNGTKLTSAGSGITVAVKDLGELTYQAAANEFGNNYTTFKYKVVGDGVAGGNTSVEYTATVNVLPVNDKPSAADGVFTVNELDHAVSGGPIVVNDVSNERNVDTYTYKLVTTKGDYTAFNSLFEISKLSDQNATIKVKSGAVLNYSQKDSYVVYATVTDDAKTETTTIAGALTSAEFKITVKIKNENDAPTIENQTFTIAEKQDDGSDWPVGTFVGNVVASDPDDDPLTYSVVTTGVPFKFDGSKKLVVADGSVLDYETKSTWTFKVQVSDGNLSASATVTVKLTDVNEKPDPRKIKTEYSINENSAKDALVGTFEVFDNDKISGSFEKLTYTLTGALTGAADVTIAKKNLSDIFYLEEEIKSDGTRVISIRVKNSSLLDYEALYKTSSKDAVYTATITIKDTENPAETRTTKIAILDVNEDFTATGGTFYVQEHSLGNTNVCVDKHTADGVCVGGNFGKVEANDPDVYNTSYHKLTYTIDSQKNKDAGYSEDASSFVVDNLGYIKTSANADFEADGPNPKLTYTFLVTVSDVGFSHDVKVIVKVENIEEPIIEIVTEGEGKVHENTATNFVVDKFSKESITDPDMLDKYNAIGDIYEYEIGPVEGLDGDEIFYVDPEKGWISINAGSKLDYEALFPQNSYTVNIVAKGDKGNLSIGRTIIVLDVNEKPVSHDTIISVDETIADGDVVFTLWATDPDSCSRVVGYMCKNGSHPEKYNKLSYAIVDGANLPFEINQSTGEISLKQGEKLRYIEKQQYVFNVKISDRPVDGSPVLSTTAKVTINVEDVNEPSEFRVISDLYDVDENKGANAVLNGGNIVVYDEDEADVNNISISITDKDATAALDAAKIFEVYPVGSTDETTHLTKFAIRAKKDLNYEELYKKTEGDAVFNVKLSIKDGSGTSTTHETTLRVNDVNEEPAFAQDKYEFKIKENVTVATELGQAKATDPDEYNTSFNTLYFSLDGDDAALFDIDARTGMISSISNAKFDFETKPVYVFEAVVTDGEFTKTATVTVNVEDVSETPVFSEPPELAVDENTKENASVGLVVASDDDCKSDNTCKKPTYTLAATDTDAYDYKSFKIDKTTGMVKVAKDSILNYEVQKEYSVRVVATDGDDPTLSTFVDVTIKINDVNDAPTYEKKEYVFEIHENAPVGEFMGSVVADDEDSWSKLSYALSDYETGSKDAEAFTIEDGKIYLKSNSLSFETKKTYQVWARATDNGKSKGFPNYSATTLVTINLIDDPDEPEIVDDVEKILDVAETTDDGIMTMDKPVACYWVKDEDKGQLATLVPFVTSVNDAEIDRLFETYMKKDSVCLYVRKGVVFDYEKNPNYKLKLSVMDADGLVGSLNKTIPITDVNERPVISGNRSFSFYEGMEAGFIIGKLDADDIDKSAKFRDNVFSAVDGDTDLFTVAENGSVIAKRDFDFEKETRRMFELRIALSDRNHDNYPNLTVSAKILITLMDAPEIVNNEFSVDENSKGVLVATLQTECSADYDKLQFELAEESPYVRITPNGEIWILDNADIDFETMTQFTFRVLVKDAVDYISEGEITIKVNDVNEAPVIKPQTFEIAENTSTETEIGLIQAEDADVKNDVFNQLQFVMADTSSVFEIKPDGSLVLKKSLDYETQNEYVIHAVVADASDITLADTAEITIKVNDVNEAPVIKPQTFEIAENTSTETEIGLIQAEDADVKNDVFNQLQFVMADTSSVFEIKPDGSLVLKKKLDYETQSEYVIHAVVADASDETLADTAEIKIVVTDVNEMPVVAKNFEFTLHENESKGYVVGELSGSDVDTVKNFSQNIFRAVAGDTAMFSVSKDGVIKTKRSFDYENKKQRKFELDVEFADIDSENYPDLLATTTVTIKVENVPEFSIALVDAKHNDLPPADTFYTDGANIIYRWTMDGKSLYTDTTLKKQENIIKRCVEFEGENRCDSLVVMLNAEPPEVFLYGESIKPVESDIYTIVEKVDFDDSVLYVNDEILKVFVSVKDPALNISESDSLKIDLSRTVNLPQSVYKYVRKNHRTVTDSYDTTINGMPVSVAYDEKVALFKVTYTDDYGMEGEIAVSYWVDKNGTQVKNEKGDLTYEILCKYENVFMNSAKQSLKVVLDKNAPEVKILSPQSGSASFDNNIYVNWSVDEILQDTLNYQGLETGKNRIVRVFRDKAGNESADTVYVEMIESKFVSLSIEQPLTVISREMADLFYAENSPQEGETFAVSIKNPVTQKEVETLVGGSFKTRKGSGKEPYPGMNGKHLGPTIAAEMRLPTIPIKNRRNMNKFSGFATLEDLIDADGRIPLKGKNSKDKDRVTPEQYVQKYCEENMGSSERLDRLNLFDSEAMVDIWVYSSLGDYVDHFSFTQDLNNADYVDEVGVMTLFVEMKPDREGLLHSESGVALATGVYIYNVKVTLRAKQRCKLPSDISDKEMGYVYKTTSPLLKKFGYRRTK